MRQIVVEWTGGIPGFGDATVGGRFAISRPGIAIVTDTGTVPQVGNRAAYYLRVANEGERLAAAYDPSPDRAKEWMGSVLGWQDRGLVCGTNPVIYDASNALVVVTTCQPPTGSQGWRYLDEATGQLVTADATYADPARGLWEYTAWPDLRIGQGQTGVKVWTPDLGTRTFAFEQLRPTGDLRFIRARRVADDFAITVVDLTAHRTTVTWATLADLRGQPVPPPLLVCRQCGRPKVDHLHVPLVGGGDTAICPRNVYLGS